MLSIITPLQPYNSSCGYCGPPGKRSEEPTSYHVAEIMPMQLSCEVYQKMIDRGWRRSGTYCYKPDLKRSCCPQYTIKLDALNFKPSKSQRKLVNRFNRWVVFGDGDDERNEKKSKGTSNDFSLREAIHGSEYLFIKDVHPEPAHRFEITLEPSSYTDEKFALYQCYQKEIHNEEKEKSPSSFTRFLVDTPLHREPIPYSKPPPGHLPTEYGSFHQLYRLDGELVAMGVIDILPNCVSSVYFMYNSQWEKFSLGKLSALREVTLAKEIYDAGVQDMQHLYMGFYIESCAKMRYKGEYSPSYLADPEDYKWYPLEECKKLLQKNRYVSFSYPEHSIEGAYSGPSPKPRLSSSHLKNVRLLKSVKDGVASVIPVTTSQYWKQPGIKLSILTTVESLGLEMFEKGDTIIYMRPSLL